MAKLVWALLCRRVIIDAQTNLLSYVDALDGFNVPQFPSASPLIIACTVWHRESQEERRLVMKVVVHSPNGAVLFESDESSLELEPVHKRGRINLGIAGFELPEPGQYQIGIRLKQDDEWTEVHRVALDVDPVVAVSMVQAKPEGGPSQARGAKKGTGKARPVAR
jgi:hypothetical protein